MTLSAAERPLPGVPGAVVRTVARLPDSLPGAVRVGPYSVARPGAVLRIVPGLATFLAQDGEIVEVAAEPDANPIALESLLYGALAAALIHQRGDLPLHGATLTPPGGGPAVAIVGPQGAGKSTLAYALHRRGWGLLSDDMTCLSERDGRILAWPGRSGVKLCPDACARYGLDAGVLPQVVGDRDKVIAPADPRRDPQPLGLIVSLERGGEDAVSAVTGASAMALLTENTFRATYIAPLGQTRAHMAIALKIAASVRILRLKGSGSPDAFADTMAQLAATPIAA